MGLDRFDRFQADCEVGTARVGDRHLGVVEVVGVQEELANAKGLRSWLLVLPQCNHLSGDPELDAE
jgi:hypothetical protein